MKNNPQITLILGTGSHQDKLVEAIKTYKNCFEVFTYYPKFTHTIYDSNGTIVKKSTSIFWNFFATYLWAIIIRIKLLKSKNYHTYISYVIFDWWVSKNYFSNSKLLWGWSQVSLKTIKSFKRKKKPIILEKAMIHIDEWNEILNKEYKKYAPDSYQYYFLPSMATQRMKKEYQLADTIVILSTYAKNTFTKNGIDKEKLTVINLYSDIIAKQNNIIKSDNEVNILFVGRIDVLKGIPRLLNVIDELFLSNPSIILTLVGDLKEEVSHLLDKKRIYLRLVDSVSKNLLPDYYAKADVFVLPSVQESFGLVLLEALSYDLEVVASINTGAPDIAINCDKVHLFDPFNEDEMKEKILEAIYSKESEKKKCTMNSYSKVQYEINVKSILQKYING